MDAILWVALGIAIGGLTIWVARPRIDRRRLGTTYAFGTGRWGSPLVRSRDQMPPAELEQLRRAVDQLVGIDTSALREVIGVGASSTQGEVTVELIAIEIREEGCRGILRYRSVIEIDESRPFTRFGEPEVTVTDGVGTHYETGLASWSGSTSGGEAGFHFAPPPPNDAGPLTITINRFRESRLPPGHPFSGPPEGISGPWTFVVDVLSGR